MKQIISTVAVAAITVMASCSSPSTMREKEAAMQAQQKTIDSLQVAMARQHVIDSMNQVAKDKEAASKKTVVYSAPAKKARRSTPAKSASYSQNAVGSYAGNSAPVYEPVAAPEKRGWSAKAKGAVIGTGVGAAAGAIINKRNRVAGGIIGGVLGAGAGTGIGAIIDKKNGR